MSPELSPECPECRQWRDAYWRAINESVRLEGLLGATQDGPERERIRAQFESTELIRIRVRDIFLRHKQTVHDLADFHFSSQGGERK